MVVGDLNFGGAALMPAEKDPPLLIDANAPKPFEIAGQCFKPVGRRHTELVNRQGAMELAQFHQGALLQVARKPPGEFPSEYSGGLFAGKAFNHAGGLLSNLVMMARGNSLKSAKRLPQVGAGETVKGF